MAKLFGMDEPWHVKPLRKGWAHWSSAGTSSGSTGSPGSNYVEWAGRPTRPITQSEVDYFGDDAFDLDDKFADETLQQMKVSSDVDS